MRPFLYFRFGEAEQVTNFPVRNGVTLDQLPRVPFRDVQPGA
jgi:hypothetical protein